MATAQGAQPQRAPFVRVPRQSRAEPPEEPEPDQAQPRPPAGSNWSDAIASGLWAGVDMVVVCSAALMGAIAVSFFLGKIK